MCFDWSVFDYGLNHKMFFSKMIVSGRSIASAVQTPHSKHKTFAQSSLSFIELVKYFWDLLCALFPLDMNSSHKNYSIISNRSNCFHWPLRLCFSTSIFIIIGIFISRMKCICSQLHWQRNETHFNREKENCVNQPFTSIATIIMCLDCVKFLFFSFFFFKRKRQFQIRSE